MPVKLSPRLLTAVPYVRAGRPVADVGTDHAYLPIYLCEIGRLTPVTTANGAVLCAVASDINRGPVERAAAHIAAAGLTAHIRTMQTDGLHGLEAYDPDTVIVFGMGGELIASILSDAPWLCRSGRRLILQPMTHAERLRAYLTESGFSIIGETLSREGERIYQTICADWNGTLCNDTPRNGTPAVPLSPAELAVGQRVYRQGDAVQLSLYTALIDRTIRTETAARDARRAAGQPTAETDALLASLAELRAALSDAEASTKTAASDT